MQAFNSHLISKRKGNFMHQIPEYYEQRISELQAEIDYLHGLLDLAKIPYKKSTKNTDDENDLRQGLMESDQGARIIPVNLMQMIYQEILKSYDQIRFTWGWRM